MVACLALACERKAKTKGNTLKGPAPFAETIFTEVTPTADGGAYAIGFDSGLWYMHGSEAVKVRFADNAPNAADTFYVGLQITPLIDGGAYAYSMLDKSFWYLREGTAQKVKDVPHLSIKPSTGASVRGFPLYISERKKRLDAEAKLESGPSGE